MLPIGESQKKLYIENGKDFKTCQNLGIDFIGIDVEKNGKLNSLGAKTVFNDFLNDEQILEALKSSA